MGLIWLLMVLLLGWAGLPWFVALGLALLLFALVSGMDSLLIMLEFSALRGMDQLLAIPLLWSAARLLAPPALGDAAMDGTGAQWLRGNSGLWLLRPNKVSTPACNPGWSLLPGVAILVVWLMIGSLSPARLPTLQEIFLAGLIPAILVWMLFALPGLVRSAAAPSSPAPPDSVWHSGHWLAMLAALLLLAGLYLGRWSLLEAASALVTWVCVLQLAAGRLRCSQIRALALAAIRDFGQLALLLGLSLAWVVLVFDNGLDRNWLQPIADLSPVGSGLLLTGIWLSLVWLLAAWKLTPLVALLIGAPWLLPAALQLGMPMNVLILVTLVSLQTGYRLRVQPALSAGRLGSELVCLMLAVTLLIGCPGLTSWLPHLLA